MSNPLQPSISLLIKLGSIIIHYQEALSSNGHYLDKATLDGLMKDEEVNEWLSEMDYNALLPKKR